MLTNLFVHSWRNLSVWLFEGSVIFQDNLMFNCRGTTNISWTSGKHMENTCVQLPKTWRTRSCCSGVRFDSSILTPISFDDGIFSVQEDSLDAKLSITFTSLMWHRSDLGFICKLFAEILQIRTDILATFPCCGTFMTAVLQWTTVAVYIFRDYIRHLVAFTYTYIHTYTCKYIYICVLLLSTYAYRYTCTNTDSHIHISVRYISYIT